MNLEVENDLRIYFHYVHVTTEPWVVDLFVEFYTKCFNGAFMGL